MRGGCAVIADPLIFRAVPLIAGAVGMGLAWKWSGSPDWLGLVRTVMMTLGGLVVIAIILVVAVAVVSGVLGMAGRLRKKS